MRTFFIEPSNIQQDIAHLRGAEATHLYKVLRLSAGQIIGLFDGTGMIYTAQISEISKNRVQAIIIASEQSVSKAPFLHIGQAVIKKKGMNFVIQKGTELGVESFQPFISQNCSTTFHLSSQEDRWQKIALESCKQCKRPTPPAINHVTDFKAMLTNSQGYDHKVILWENEQENNLKPFPPGLLPNSVCLLIGPEGGFTTQEIAQAKSVGFTALSLGQRILRAETASIAATTIFQYLLGNMDKE